MNCQIIKYDIKLTKPFRYFLGDLDSLPYSKIIITDNEGVAGEGEIAHALDINGELQESAEYYIPYIDSFIGSSDTVSSVKDIDLIMKKIRLNMAHNTGFLCGIEQALFNIVSKKTGKNISQLLGVNQDREILIQITIPYFQDLNGYTSHIKNILTENKPKHVKFKVGKNLELEISAIQFLRETDLSVSISVDANQAFDNSNDAISFAKKLEGLGVAWAEQLLHKDNISGLKELRLATKLPLMIDEGLHTPLEAEYYAKEKLTDYFNIKLAKTGGILKALEIIDIAKKNNIPVMLGSMLHGKLGIEYNLGFALTQDLITQDFFSYFSVEETKDLEYITNTLAVSYNTLYK